MLCSQQPAMLQHGNHLCGIDATWFLQAGYPVFSNLGSECKDQDISGTALQR